MKDIALRRLNILTIHKGSGFDARYQRIFRIELAKLGYNLKNPELLDQTCPSFLFSYQYYMQDLAAMRGGNVEYVPLFSGFPDQVPEQDTYFIRRVFGYLGNVMGLFTEGVKLQNGMTVPEWLLDTKEFGANPITQFQDEALYEAGKKAQKGRKGDTDAVLIDVELVFRDEVIDRLKAWACDCLYAGSSIREVYHEDLHKVLALLKEDEIDLDRITMKENKALALKAFWEAEHYTLCAQLLDTPTDVLRLFAALTETDISLSTRMRFPKLNRPQRRLILDVLSEAKSLPEDLNRYRGLWLQIDRYLHSYEHRKHYPKVAMAFKALREDSITTFNGRTEALIKAGDLKSLMTHLSKRPGVFARKIHEVLRKFPLGHPLILDAFSKVAPRLTVKQLLVLVSYFSTINNREYRTIINKKGKITVIKNTSRYALRPRVERHIVDVMEECILTILRQKESWDGKVVYIDPELANYTVPFQERAASESLLTYPRGTRIPVQLDKVLRLFVYWKEVGIRTDLDLSLIAFDHNYQYLRHVSYTRLASQGIVHSGDIQSAPHGAAEFIDVSLNALQSDTRFLAVQVYRYCGDTFANLKAHVGWMVRKKIDNAYKSFDIKTVENKIDLHGTAAYSIPLLVDLEENRIIITDLYMNGLKFYNRVETSTDDISSVVRGIADFVNTRPNMKSLAEFHTYARHGYPGSQEEADISFGIKGHTFNACETHKVLAELV